MKPTLWIAFCQFGFGALVRSTPPKRRTMICAMATGKMIACKWAAMPMSTCPYGLARDQADSLVRSFSRSVWYLNRKYTGTPIRTITTPGMVVAGRYTNKTARITTALMR